MTSDEAISGDTASGSFAQTYDRNGDVTSESRSLAGVSGVAGTGSQTFAYDGLDRVTSATLGSTTTTYTYDRDGNRTSVSDGTTTTSDTYDVTDQLVAESDGGTPIAFDYDPYGDLTQDAESATSGVTTDTYDLGGRLIGTTAPAASATYTYDALGRVTTRTAGSTTDTYSYAGASSELVRDAGATTFDLLVAPALGTLSENAGTTRSWLLDDLHGNVAGTAAQDLSAFSDLLRYTPYGTLAGPIGNPTSSPPPLGYQGRLRLTPSGTPELDAAGARLYSPGLGVFTSPDSLLGSAADPLSRDRYLYAEANPTSLIDPSGHCAAPAAPGALGLGEFAFSCVAEVLPELPAVGENVWNGIAGLAAVVVSTDLTVAARPALPRDMPQHAPAGPAPVRPPQVEPLPESPGRQAGLDRWYRETDPDLLPHQRVVPGSPMRPPLLPKCGARCLFVILGSAAAADILVTLMTGRPPDEVEQRSRPTPPNRPTQRGPVAE